MRILILVHSLTGGGAERVAALWANGFAGRGHEVAMVLSCGGNSPMTYKVTDGIKIFRLHSWLANKLYRRLGIDSWYVWHLHRIVKDFRPEVIIGVLEPWSHWARKATQGMNIPIVNTEHNSFERPTDAPMKKEHRKMKWEWNKQYDHVTILTQADLEFTTEYRDKVTVLPNPLAFQPAERVPEKENIILAAGRLDAWHYKGFDLLIKAWGKVAKNHPDWKLQIAGRNKNNTQQYLQSLVDEAGLDHQLEFIGYQEDMLPIYQRSSIFILSSRYEGFGMVLIEAMSQGCAPIACDYKGRQREIITSEAEGLVCPVNDADALAAAIERMITDDKFRMTVQAGAIERSKYYSVESTMNRWEEIFNKLQLR